MPNNRLITNNTQIKVHKNIEKKKTDKKLYRKNVLPNYWHTHNLATGNRNQLEI